MTPSLDPTATAASNCLLDGGATGALMRAMDWSATALGPVETWPPSLRVTVSTALSSQFPILIFWGRELIQIYNDAYRPILGDKHPRSMGQPARECWPEIWHVIGPMLDRVWDHGEPTRSERQLLVLERRGFPEECYFTSSYSPIRDENGVAGVFCVATETTKQVLGERRLRTLRDLRVCGEPESQTVEQACLASAAILAGNPHDFAFALIYLPDEEGKRLRLIGRTPIGGTSANPATVTVGGQDDVWEFRRVAETGQGQIIDGLEAKFGRLPAGPWADDQARQTLVLPLAKFDARELPAGFLVVGLSPRLELDGEYRAFLDLAAGQVASVISRARAVEEERKRAEGLAESDWAKTSLSSNVSHELQTPLTQMPGPLDTPAPAGLSPAAVRDDLEAAKALRESEERFGRFMRHLPGLAWIKNAHGQYVYANKAVEKAFRTSLEGLYGRTDAEIFPPEAARQFTENDQRALASEEGIQVIETLEHQDGILHHSLVSKFPIPGPDGQSALVGGMAIDITERVRAEAEREQREEDLRLRTAQYQTLLNQAPLGVYVVDADCKVRDVNPTALLAFGSTPDLVGRDFGDLTHTLWEKEYADEVARILRHTLETGEPHHTPERAQYRIDLGATEYYEWRVDRIPLPHGRHGVVCYFRDISAQVLARLAIAESEERFRTLADNIAQFTWMADAKGAAFWHNRRWYEYTGATVEEMQGWGWTKVHHPDHLERVVKKVQYSWETGQRWEDTFPLRGKDGNYRWFLSRAVPIRDADGRIVRWFGTNTDITEQRAAQEALKEADRRKDEFLATLAHELRNPLAPIRMGLDLMKMTEDDPAKSKDIRNMMERQTQQLIMLVDDLLDVSRITRGKLELRKCRIGLADVVQSAIETSRPFIDASGHELTIDLPREPILLEADPNRLAQILSNLLTTRPSTLPAAGASESPQSCGPPESR